MTISSAWLTTTDADNTTAQLVYTITSGPTYGTVKRSGSATTSFTQADINAGLSHLPTQWQRDDQRQFRLHRQ